MRDAVLHFLGVINKSKQSYHFQHGKEVLALFENTFHSGYLEQQLRSTAIKKEALRFTLAELELPE